MAPLPIQPLPKHQVWEPSFDWKECRGLPFTNQKLDYMHANPCVGKWDLAESPAAYQHNSARFYTAGVHSSYPVTNVEDLADVDLTTTD